MQETETPSASQRTVQVALVVAMALLALLVSIPALH